MRASVVIIYIAMLIFDAAAIAGCAYLIVSYNWSAWWMLVAIFIAAGSNPRSLLRSMQGAK